jgi:hypothetical protein
MENLSHFRKSGKLAKQRAKLLRRAAEKSTKASSRT